MCIRDRYPAPDRSSIAAFPGAYGAGRFTTGGAGGKGMFNGESLVVLDSFAGSGTTAHAALNMNKADGGNRKFILVEMMDYADSITAERLRRVIQEMCIRDRHYRAHRRRLGSGGSMRVQPGQTPGEPRGSGQGAG